MTDQSMPSLLMKAAQSAAEADGVSNEEGVVASNVLSSNGANNNALDMATAKAQMVVQQRQQQQRKPSSSGGSSKKKGQQLRRGKWTPEEEAYANRLIQEFKAGLLPLTDGTTLRTFLSKLLNCDPMRISKKFVGSNCIGKQVFRRRTADLNRLTPDQIQKSRAELSELERRFLERVAQTNRVKNSSAVGGGANQGGHHNNLHNQHMQNRQPMGSVGGVNSSHHNAVVSAALSAAAAANGQGMMNGRLNGNGGFRNLQTNPPWMQPPLGYKQGLGAQMARDNLSSASGHANSRTAAAGRALLEGLGGGNGRGNHFKNGEANNSNSMMAMAELQRRASMQMGFGHQSAQNLLAALSGGNSNQSLVQMARNASTNGSFNNLMKGFSRDQLSQLARDRGLSSASLSNMDNNGPRKNSFDQLMSLDFQSLQSIDNLANLIQTGGKPGGNTAPSIGMKNWSADHGNNNGNNNGGMLNGSLSNAARRLASHNNFESLMRNLSSTNNLNGRNGMNQHFGSDNFGNSSSNNPLNGNDNDENNNNVNTGTSNANLQSLLQSMNSGKGSTSMSSLLGGGGNNASAASLANLLQRADNSSTGLSALRNSDGLNGRNTTSVEDFLSLVAAGDIPHQDPNVLNLPLSQLQQHQQQNANNNGGQQGRGDGDKDNNNGDNINHQQNDTANILAQATGNSALANALASRSFGSNMGSFADLSRNNLSSLGSTAELLQQLADSGGGSSSSNLKRKLLDVEGSLEAQGVSKR